MLRFSVSTSGFLFSSGTFTSSTDCHVNQGILGGRTVDDMLAILLADLLSLENRGMNQFQEFITVIGVDVLSNSEKCTVRYL